MLTNRSMPERFILVFIQIALPFAMAKVKVKVKVKRCITLAS
jgi:hypothetical protein